MKRAAISIVIIFAMLISGLAYAANEKVATQQTSEPAEKMTYGKCVSNNAEIKNTCKAAAKDTLATCKEKADAKQCKQAYKQTSKQCKATFKAAKKECAKIKHNFLETLGSVMK